MVTALSLRDGGLGRFGNQLWTISGCIGVAVKNNETFAFPEWINQDNALFGGSTDEMRQFFVNPLPMLPEGMRFERYPYFWGYRDIKLNGNWDMFLHMQSPKYFEHCLELVRHYLTMKDEPEQNEYCAIHYRAGDYIDDPNAFHPRCTKEYYAEAIARMPKGTEFMIFSDDIDYFFKNIIFRLPANLLLDYKIRYSEGKNYIEDFKLMKKCKHFIIANSSFSSMAATLADHPDKIIISPKKWFGKEGESWDTTCIHPPNAILI